MLNEVDLMLEHGERVSLVGRNGQGKSSLMKLVTGEIKPDDGQINFEEGAKLAYLPQDVPQHIEGNVFDVVAGGLGEMAALLSEYQTLSAQLTQAQDENVLERIEKLQQRIDDEDGWRLQELVNKAISHLKLEASWIFNALSGGVKRRVLLAKAIVSKPNLLILDEPTNHLDVDTILWLEQELKHMGCALLFVTHDRAFLKSLATYHRFRTGRFKKLPPVLTINTSNKKPQTCMPKISLGNVKTSTWLKKKFGFARD